MVKIVYGPESEPFLAQADTLPECIEKVQNQLVEMVRKEMDLNQKEITLLLEEKSMGNWDESMAYAIEDFNEINELYKDTIADIRKSKTVASLNSLNLLADDWMVRRLS